MEDGGLGGLVGGLEELVGGREELLDLLCLTLMFLLAITFSLHSLSCSWLRPALAPTTLRLPYGFS